MAANHSLVHRLQAEDPLDPPALETGILGSDGLGKAWHP
jgi:hypothetical protein